MSAGGCGCESDRDGTVATGGHTATASVGLREVARIRSVQNDAADEESCGADVVERHQLRSAGGTHVLVRESQAASTQRHDRRGDTGGWRFDGRLQLPAR